MRGPPRRRVDFTTLPAVARYALALAVLAAVVALVLLARGNHQTSPASWYTAVVRVGAVLLLVYLAARLIQWLARAAKRP
jgi:hypothetical protein